MTALGYDQTWIDQLRVQASRVLEELRPLRSADPEAADALRTLDDVRRFVEQELLAAAVRLATSSVLHVAIDTGGVTEADRARFAIGLFDGAPVRTEGLGRHELIDVLERLDRRVGEELWRTAEQLPRGVAIADLDLTGLDALAEELAARLARDPTLAGELLDRPELWSALAVLLPLADVDDDVVVALAERLLTSWHTGPHDDAAVSWLLAAGTDDDGLRARLARLIVALPGPGPVDWTSASPDDLLEAARTVHSPVAPGELHDLTDASELRAFAQRLATAASEDAGFGARLLELAHRPELAVLVGLADFPPDFVVAYARRAVSTREDARSAIDRWAVAALLDDVADDVDLAKRFVDDGRFVADLARGRHAPEFAEALTAISMLAFVIRDSADVEGSIRFLDRIVEFSAEHPAADLSDPALDALAFGFRWHAWHLTVDNRLQTPADGIDVKVASNRAVDLGEHDDLARVYGQVAADPVRQEALATVIDELGDLVAGRFAATLADPTATVANDHPSTELTPAALGARLRAGLRNVVALEQLVLDDALEMEIERRCARAADRADERRRAWSVVQWATSLVPAGRAGQSVLGVLRTINSAGGAPSPARTAETSVSFNGDTRATALVAVLSSPPLLDALGAGNLASEHPERWAVLVEVAHRRNRGDHRAVLSPSGEFLATDIDDALGGIPGSGPISAFLDAADVDSTHDRRGPTVHRC